MPPIGVNLFGLEVVVTACVLVFDKWRRTHRNNRIKKKWQKRYGYTTRCTHSGTVYTSHRKVVMCACTESKVRKELERGSDRVRTYEAPPVKVPPFRCHQTA